MSRLTILFAAALALWVHQPARADDLGYIVPGYDLDGTEIDQVAPMTLGWSFQFRGNYRLLGLGMIDTGAAGFASVHQVSLWDSGGNRLLTVVVDPATPSFGGIGLVPFAQIYWLAPGNYTLSASNVGREDGFIQTYASLSREPYVRFQTARWAPGSADQFPSATSDLIRVGPAMWFAVPEPATWMLSLIGFAAIGTALRRRPPVKDAVHPLA